MEDVDDFLARPDHRFGPLPTQRKFLQQLFGGGELDHFRDPLIPHPIPFGALHPDEHFVVAFLQNV